MAASDSSAAVLAIEIDRVQERLALAGRERFAAPQGPRKGAGHGARLIAVHAVAGQAPPVEPKAAREALVDPEPKIRVLVIADRLVEETGLLQGLSAHHDRGGPGHRPV